MVAISVDEVETSAALAARLGVTFPLASDPEHAVIDAYGVLDVRHEIAWPAVYLVGPEGRILWRFLDDDYRRRPSADDVLATIDRLAE